MIYTEEIPGIVTVSVGGMVFVLAAVVFWWPLILYSFHWWFG